MLKLFSVPGIAVAIEKIRQQILFLKILSVHRACRWPKSEAE
jgi:hypothetical protein